ncbi:MAG: TraB/GumN family protein, partial [Gammaproteobacteria bacterium]|nr:TraB/GumN family protein [Gammaproteobacteria bacterium]
TLRDLMGDQLYKEAVAAAEVIDIPLEMLSKTEPWYAAMTIEMMMLSRFGFSPTLGIEMYMLTKATQDGKRIDGFETIEEQIQFLDSMSLPAQREMLIATLHESAKLGDMMDEVIDAWRRGDIAGLEAGILDDLQEQEELNQALVVGRNKRWVERIESLLEDDEDYLIIVGALHLVGRDGVPKQLLRNGYDVRQLSEPPTVR